MRSDPPENPWATPWVAQPQESERFTAQQCDPDRDDAWAAKGLRKAIIAENLELAREKISEGADVNNRDGDGRTALHYAARIGAVDIVDLLMEHGADVNAGDKWGGRPADEAEYWAVKVPKGCDGTLRLKCLAVLDALRSRGGVRCELEQRPDVAYHAKVRQKLEEEARQRGVEPPWQMEIYKALLPPHGVPCGLVSGDVELVGGQHMPPDPPSCASTATIPPSAMSSSAGTMSTSGTRPPAPQSNLRSTAVPLHPAPLPDLAAQSAAHEPRWCSCICAADYDPADEPEHGYLKVGKGDFLHCLFGSSDHGSSKNKFACKPYIFACLASQPRQQGWFPEELARLCEFI